MGLFGCADAAVGVAAIGAVVVGVVTEGAGAAQEAKAKAKAVDKPKIARRFDIGRLLAVDGVVIINIRFICFYFGKMQRRSYYQ